MIKHMEKKNRMFAVKLHLTASQCDDFGRKPLNKQWWLSRGYGTEHNTEVVVVYIYVQ